MAPPAAHGLSAGFTDEANLPFIDGEAIVIDKPAGLPVDRPRRGGACLDDYLPALSFGFQRYPAAVHRLDQDTSGCLLLARNPKALKRFGAAFAEGRVAKRYLGVLAGEPEGDGGVIDLPLGKTSSAERGWRMVVDERGKPSVTHWRRIAAHDGLTLVEFRPETGRTHQIRVHALAGLGVPLLGDPVYGAPHRQGLMLHAVSLHIERPGKTPVDAHAPLPQRFIDLGFAANGG
ncbi:MAG: RNA pseudouridine synthase [Blastomonas sp.]